MDTLPFIPIDSFLIKATAKQKELINKIKSTFSSIFYDDIKEVCSIITTNETIYYIEIFTKSGSLVTSIDISNFEYMIEPNYNLCLVANDIDSLTDTLYMMHMVN